MTTTTETLREACPTCDRVECPNWTHTPTDAGGMSDAEWNAYSTRCQNAFDECQRHAVDWRAEALRLRALTAESRSLAGTGEPTDGTYAAELENLCILMHEELSADIDGCDVGANHLRAAAHVALRKRDAAVAKIANWVRAQSPWTSTAEALADAVTRGEWRRGSR